MAHIGYGIQLKMGDAATPEVFTALAELLNLSGPGITMESVDTTHAASVNAWKTAIAGLLDAGEVTVDLAFLPADGTQDNTTGLLSKMIGRAAANFQLIFPDGSATQWAFPALVTGFEPTEPLEDRATASVTLKISGAPTLA